MASRDFSAGESFQMDELRFVENPPKQLEMECPVCLQVMLEDPHLSSCCGHHFCGPCIERVKGGVRPCPLCNHEGFQTMPNKGLQRSIGDLQVLCTMSEIGCEWVGELRGLNEHLSRCLREGECIFVTVACRYGCGLTATRFSLQSHEQHACPKRPFACPYCTDHVAEYEDITTLHVLECKMYPLYCPNHCNTELVLPRQDMEKHLRTDCPLEVISCELNWAKCNVRLPRKDMDGHMQSQIIQHTSLLARAAETTMKENERLKKENDQLKSEITSLQQVQHLNFSAINLLQGVTGMTKTLPLTCSLVSDKGKCYQQFLSHVGGYLVGMVVYHTDSSTDLRFCFTISDTRQEVEKEWPFKGNITIRVLNQLGDHSHFEKTIACREEATQVPHGMLWARPGQLPITMTSQWKEMYLLDHFMPGKLQPPSSANCQYKANGLVNLEVLRVLFST